jgi:hypothetical protein
MSHPTPVPTSQAEQDRIKRGAKVTLDVRKQYRGVTTTATEASVTVLFEGTEDLAQQLGQVDANEAHLLISIHHPSPKVDFAMILVLNNPKASADTSPETPGFIGGLTLFEDPQREHPMMTFRFPLTEALKTAQIPGQTPVTVTIVSIPFPGRDRTPQVLEVMATVDLVKASVEQTQ